MRKSIAILAFVAAALMAAAPSFAADIATVLNNQPQSDNFKIIHVNDLARLMADPNSHVHVYDADPQSVRESDGMIPGARPLTSSGNYDVAEELPTNKHAKLVFYCHNQH